MRHLARVHPPYEHGRSNGEELTRFCTHCAELFGAPAAPADKPSRGRVCATCGLGVILTCASATLDAPRAAFLVVTADLRVSAASRAAERLGVSPNTLRSGERRFGSPEPRRTAGGHRQYELSELEALRRALLETHNISSAIQVARQRGEGLGSSSRLLEAFDRFDEGLADRLMEESLALRSIERSVEELLLPALEMAEGREGREAEYELACRWATGWLHAARRVS